MPQAGIPLTGRLQNVVVEQRNSMIAVFDLYKPDPVSTRFPFLAGRMVCSTSESCIATF
jgi:hypothetical protein